MDYRPALCGDLLRGICVWWEMCGRVGKSFFCAENVCAQPDNVRIFIFWRRMSELRQSTSVSNPLPHKTSRQTLVEESFAFSSSSWFKLGHSNDLLILMEQFNILVNELDFKKKINSFHISALDVKPMPVVS